MSAYSPADWHDFFVASVSASAALLGLLFVAVSMNIQLILKYAHLPGRASASLGTLLTALVVCCLGLAPTQGRATYGWEIVAVTVLAGTQAAWVSTGRTQPGDPRSWTIQALPLLFVPPLVLFGGGVSLVSGGGGGLYWVLYGTILAFIAASINAWVLMVEILR